ncbi:MAG: transcription antitermination factor NusB [Chloroherpetonaceae bacterium]
MVTVVNRRLVREVVMQILYAYDIRKEDIRKVAEGILPEEISSQPKARDFAFGLLEKIIPNLSLIDSKIKSHAENWELDRMAIIDKNLMRIAIAEMLYFPDVPPKVSINEAIEIAKQYSTDKSGRFVNGILDAVRLELIKNGEMNKSGRGLVDMPAKRPKDAHQPPVVVVNEPPPQFKEMPAPSNTLPQRPQQQRRLPSQSSPHTSDKPANKPNPHRKQRGGSDSRNNEHRKR